MPAMCFPKAYHGQYSAPSLSTFLTTIQAFVWEKKTYPGFVQEGKSSSPPLHWAPPYQLPCPEAKIRPPVANQSSVPSRTRKPSPLHLLLFFPPTSLCLSLALRPSTPGANLVYPPTMSSAHIGLNAGFPIGHKIFQSDMEAVKKRVRKTLIHTKLSCMPQNCETS